MRATICIASLSLLWPETQTLSRKLVLHKPAQQVVSSKPIHSLGEKIWQIHSGSFFFAMCVVRDATAASRHWWGRCYCVSCSVPGPMSIGIPNIRRACSVVVPLTPLAFIELWTHCRTYFCLGRSVLTKIVGHPSRSVESPCFQHDQHLQMFA